MAKKSTGKKQPVVVSRHGEYRFQTGMVTASLLGRGLNMDDAFKVSRQLRDRVADRDSITTDELEAEIDTLLASLPGIESAPAETSLSIADGPARPLIRAAGRLRRFSREALVHDFIAIGVDVQSSLDLTNSVVEWLRTLDEDEISIKTFEKAVGKRLADHAGKSYARRYRLMRWIRRADRPVVILIGGATGAGKSTLATEIATRLGIRVVTSTDMIRETMRTVLSSELLPGLHDHSFRGVVQGGQVLSDPRERVLAGFHQQAAQVAVGIRAVIRRAYRESTSIIIEGTHILPPFEQYLPPDSELHWAGLVLAVPTELQHLQRFPDRLTSQPARRSEGYLESFQSVRWIHDEVMALAEDSESVVLASDEPDETIARGIGYLSRALPVKQSAPTFLPSRRPDIRTLFVIFDGLADEPNSALGGLTPLAAAHTPTLCALAGNGGQGQVLTGGDPNHAPETDEGMASLLGVKWHGHKVKRGLFEAVGQGVPLTPGSVLIRGNLATVEPGGAIVDRRAGRIRAGVGDLLDGLKDIELPGGVRGTIYPGHEHRVIVQLHGESVSGNVSDSDPGSDAALQCVADVRPLDDTPEAARTAEALRALLRLAATRLSEHPHNAERIERGLMSANAIITRGAESVDAAAALPKAQVQAALVAACPTALGVARVLGIQATNGPHMTGNLDTDLDEKFDAARALFEDYPFVVVHLKGTDIAAHDRRPIAKRDFIAAADAALGRFLAENPDVTDGLRVVVSADHGTSSSSGQHLADPVPVLLAGWPATGGSATFDERSAARGALGLLQSDELSEMLW